MSSDETLWSRYLEGDESGLIGLMDRYGSSLTFYIDGYLHDVDGARNLALRFVAKNRRHRCFGFEDLGQDLESKTLIEEVVQTQERDRILRQCMEQLNPDYREALYLVYFENMRHAEAAAVMRKSEKQVADLVYRGKHSLRKRLKQEGITSAEY